MDNHKFRIIIAFVRLFMVMVIILGVSWAAICFDRLAVMWFTLLILPVFSDWE